MVYCTGKEYGTVYNDVLAIQSPVTDKEPDRLVIEKIKQLLLVHGFADWLQRD
jgi:hypothetical protein